MLFSGSSLFIKVLLSGCPPVVYEGHAEEELRQIVITTVLSRHFLSDSATCSKMCLKVTVWSRFEHRAAACQLAI